MVVKIKNKNNEIVEESRECYILLI
jgi:hypothetical protein